MTDNATGDEAGLPIHLFTKSSPTLLTGLVTTTANLLAAKHAFYVTIRGEVDIEAPMGRYAAWNSQSNRSLFRSTTSPRHATPGPTHCRSGAKRRQSRSARRQTTGQGRHPGRVRRALERCEGDLNAHAIAERFADGDHVLEFITVPVIGTDCDIGLLEYSMRRKVCEIRLFSHDLGALQLRAAERAHRQARGRPAAFVLDSAKSSGSSGIPAALGMPHNKNCGFSPPN